LVQRINDKVNVNKSPDINILTDLVNIDIFAKEFKFGKG